MQKLAESIWNCSSDVWRISYRCSKAVFLLQLKNWTAVCAGILHSISDVATTCATKPELWYLGLSRGTY